MGQKAHPNSLRIGVIRGWESRWFLEKKYADFLLEDFKIRKFIDERLVHAGISRIEIERTAGKILVIVHTAKPGIIIGKKGSEVDELRKEIQSMTKKEIYISIQEVRIPALDAQLVAKSIAIQLEKRISHKRAMKKAVISSLEAGAKGIKVMVSGKLGGNDIARREWYREGRVPLHTFRADIDYGFAEAFCTYGKLGIKVWIFKGEILSEDQIVKDVNVKDAKDAKEQKDANARKVKDLKDAKDAKDLKDLKDAKDAKSAEDADVKRAKNAKDAEDAKNAKDAEDAKDDKKDVEAKE